MATTPDEWARLRAAVRRTREGVGGAVAIGGDPGVGKTRLLVAVRETARAYGLPTVVALAAGGPDHVRLVDDYGTRTVHLAWHRPGEPAWWQIAEMLWARLAGLAGTRGAALVVDDVHRLGPDWSTVLERLIAGTATAPVLLALAYRPRQLEPSLAATLVGESAAGRLEVIRPVGQP